MSLALANRRAALLQPWLKNELWRRARAVPSLDLRFAENKSLVDATTGANLVTFTRASSGTYVDSQGVIRTAVTNLQRHSEDFTQGLTPNNATLIANQGTAPSGTLTADQFLETTANGLHSQEIVDHVFIAGATYTFSCYAKSIGGRNFAPGFSTLFSSARFGFFNLSGSGSVVSTDAGVTAFIQAVGDGWYRCVITSTCVTGGGARVGVFIASGTSISYVGDAAKGLLLWGAQLEQSSTVGEYVPTGATINSAPRFDHNPTTGESLGLLVEEQRQNLLLNSGTLSTQNVTVTAVAHTLSFTGTGTITLSGTSTAGPLVGTGTGEANRVSLTFTPTAGTLTLTVSGTVTNAQLEIGAFRTSYIPTAGTAATRAADVASIGSGSNFSSWYRQDEGTVFSDASSAGGAVAGLYEISANGDSAQSISVRLGQGFSFAQGLNRALFSYSASTRSRHAFATVANNYGSAFNGSVLTIINGQPTSMPASADKVQIGSLGSGSFLLNGHIRRLTYWPIRLGNNVLQAITQ